MTGETPSFLSALPEALASPGLQGALWLTARTCFFAGLLLLATAPLLAWWTARRRGPLVRVVQFFTTLPLVFPPIALGYLLLLLLGRNGPVGSLLFESGIRFIFSPGAVVLAAYIAALPLVVRPISTALESSALKELETAAAIHGLTPPKVFFLVTAPLTWTHVLSSLLLGLTRAMGEVGITMMLGGNIAGKTNTLSLEIYNSVSRGDFDAATALCVILSLAALVFFIAIELLRRRACKI